jgi:hypothetical protein
MKKSNKEIVHNRFVQQPDETIMVIDGKKKVWDDETNTFVDYKP